MSTFTCPKGHPSTTDDFCDTCGARITGGPTVSVAAPPPEPAAVPAGRTCPNCSTPAAGSARFCEDCGYDYTTGKVPATTPDPAPEATAGAPWTATVTADRAYFDSNDLDGVEFPTECPERRFTLVAPQVRIGRSSTSKGLHPEMDLSASPLDPGISHSHAVLTMNTDGVWMLSDLGSTNGTFVNGGTDPVTVGQMVALADGDRIHVGAWTTITIHAPV